MRADACAILALLLAACGAEADGVEPSADACKLDGGAPLVVVGQGRSAYAALEDHEIVAVEAGPQGGHHVWIALRTKALTQTGSVLTVRGRFPALGAEPPSFESGVSFHTAEDGFCEINGVRFQVDHGLDLDTLRGESLELEVAVEDADGDVAVSHKTVTLSAVDRVGD